ncbi:sodium:alanine symporter family protein [Prevotella copri]|nr:sodium:alanine symporter family protein [Segatella copri]
MDAINDFFTAFSSFLWGWPMIILLLGTHIFLTIRLRFPQRKIFKAIKLSVKKDKNATGDVSQFRALATALAATIGTGNIIGVATAIALGGPGAVFWCWLTGVFGISTKYAEGLLAVKYRVKTKRGTMLGGPMYALEKGLGWKWLAVLFALFAALASFGIGSTVQANAISTLVENQYGISPYITGTIVTALGAAVILGGVKSISKVCGMLVPFMALFYVLGCIYILCVNHAYLLPAIHVIFDSAFTTKAAGGGFAGSTMMIAARLFSNESGLGSAPIVAAAAQTRNPVRQALVSSTGTFWDTVIICALTGLVITSSIIAYPDIDYHNGAALTKAAFSKIPYIGAPILTIGLATFAFSTTLGWSYYGERCVEYLKGKKWMLCFRIVYIATIFLGSVISLGLVWNIADCMNALMAIPNLISLLCLSGIIVHETRKYLWRDQLDKDMDEKEIEELE